MSTRKLKRNISNDPNNGHDSNSAPKKPKIRKPLQLHHTYTYETPHPTASSQTEAYKLPSSVGERMSPSKFSPIPKAAQVKAKTGSTNLKENASTTSPFNKDRYPMSKNKYGSKKKKITSIRALESPLYPSSPAVVSSRNGTDQADPEKVTTFAQGTESPPSVLKPKPTARRPSAPTPPRKSDWKEIKAGVPTNGSTVDLLHDDWNDLGNPKSTVIAAGPQDVFHRAPNLSLINFNRPPSQLSLYDYNRGGDEFFSSIRGESTPFNNDRPPPFFPSTRPLRDSVSDTDTDSDPCEGGVAVLDDSDSDFDMDTGQSDSLFPSLKMASRARARSNGSGYVTPSEDDEDDHDEQSPRSPWIDDSLISAPDTRDWRLPSRSVPRYMRGEKEIKNVEMEQNVLEGMFELLITDNGTNKQSSASAQQYSCSPLERDDSPSPPMILRTRSLGDADGLRDLSQSQLEPQANPQAPTTYTRRTRSGTVVQAHKADASVTGTLALAPALPVISSVFRRTRSGTVTAGSGKPGTAVASGFSVSSSNPVATSTAISSENTRTRRTRSGTVVESSSATNSTKSNETLPPPPLPSQLAPTGTGRKRSGSIIQVPMLESVGHAAISQSSGDIPPQPIRSRTASGRTRSGSTVLQALVPTLASVGEGESVVSVFEGGDVPVPRSSRRSRSGSVQGIGAGIKAALGKFPIPGSGMLGRMATSNTGRTAPGAPPATTLAPAPPNLDRDVEMVVASSPDPLKVWSPVKRNRAQLREKGKGKGRASTNVNTRANAMAMDVDEGDESDDPLLLKPGDRFD